MKTLPLEITARGFTFRQIERRGNVALYSQHLKGRTGTPLAYEVIIIKSHDGYELGGSKVEASEVYPGQESFGTLGWTYSTLDPHGHEKALDKMRQVEETKGVKAASRAVKNTKKS
jgi:hypothetical protein